jgi:membrane-associated phospholipid phosphatase
MDPTDATEAYMSSFPSGHSSRAFTIFSTLNKYYKNPVLFYSIAVVVAFSRLYFGVHYLSDVLAGITIGLIVSHEICRRDIGTKLIRRFKNKR